MSKTAIPIPEKINLHEFLECFDFDYEVIPYDETDKPEINLRQEKLANGEFTEEEIHEPMFAFIDLQGVYLGDIDEERYLFNDGLVGTIIDRLDVYIKDYLLDDFISALSEKKIDTDYLSLEDMYLKAKELNIDHGVYYELAEYIIHSESIQVDELEQNKIEKLITEAEKKQARNDNGAAEKEHSKSEVEFHH